MTFDVGLPGARAAFSTRQGGVSESPYDSLNLGVLTDDAEERVVENRRRLASRVGLDPAHVAMGWQVHGTDIAAWDSAPAAGRDGFASPGAQLSRVDAHTTSQHDLGLLVLVADCLPVALAGGGRVAMVHCGWRPLAGKIIEKALELFHKPPAAAVGPGIGRCCYEVGPEVLEAFSDIDGVANGRMLDLRAVIESKLRAGGVAEVEHVDLCTFCREDLFFSHRRDGGATGRQSGVAWLTG